MNLAELKSRLTVDLKNAGDKLNQFEKMQLAINLRIALATVIRYTSGEELEVRRLELAESILAEANNIIKKTATA
ncbi:MAG TPA: hypothetical protein VF487_20210 [Chitinophagaceae bacterium]